MDPRRKDINAHSIQRAVIIGTIGIIALAFGWLALNQNTESRSKAALTEKDYRSWEFKNSVEGWVGENSTTLKPSADILIASFPGNTGASIRQDNANTALPYGNKYVKIVLSLTPGVAILGVSDESIINSAGSLVETGDGGYVTGSTQGGGGSGIVGTDQGCQGPGCLSPEEIKNAQPIGWPDPSDPTCTPHPPPCTSDRCPLYEPPPPRGGWCPPKPTCTPPPPPCTSAGCTMLEIPEPPGGWCPPERKPIPVSGATSFTLKIYYQLKGNTTWEKPVVKTGLSSKGTFAEYAVLLPGIPPMTVAKLKLQVSGVQTPGIGSSTDYTLRVDRIRLTGPVPTSTPKPTCTPEPPCLYSEPACAIDLPVPPGGWCTRPTPTPTRRPTPKPTCTPEPPCYYSEPYCRLELPVPPGGWCPRLTPTPTRRPTPTPTRRPTPKPTCTPEPPCLYTPPYCRLELPVPPGGWCPRPTPTPTPTRRPTPTPTRRPTPRTTPMVLPTSGARILYEIPSAQGKHWTCAFFPNASWCK